ncbi:MAG: glycine cleavage system protein GcvH [Gammaproteobacteria bacterium]|nr:glycine cleavage system protein GcvH [Gammaproteobacteria bacterium]
MSIIPEGLRYTESHEWVEIGDDGIVTIGITDHAQELLGDLVYVEPPEVGTETEAGEACGVVESVKAASDVMSPVTGEVVEANEDLGDTPELVNNDCYADGWLCKIKMSKPEELDDLMDAAAYTEFAASEDH